MLKYTSYTKLNLVRHVARLIWRIRHDCLEKLADTKGCFIGAIWGGGGLDFEVRIRSLWVGHDPRRHPVEGKKGVSLAAAAAAAAGEESRHACT